MLFKKSDSNTNYAVWRCFSHVNICHIDLDPSGAPTLQDLERFLNPVMQTCKKKGRVSWNSSRNCEQLLRSKAFHNTAHLISIQATTSGLFQNMSQKQNLKPCQNSCLLSLTHRPLYIWRFSRSSTTVLTHTCRILLYVKQSGCWIIVRLHAIWTCHRLL